VYRQPAVQHACISRRTVCAATDGQGRDGNTIIDGVSVGTVQADRQVFSSEHLANEPQTTRMRVDPVTGEVEDVPVELVLLGEVGDASQVLVRP